MEDQVVSWFALTRNQIQAEQGGRAIPSLAFVHIPPSITAAFQASGQRHSHTEPGLNEEILTAQADQTTGADLPFLQALVQTPGLMAVFSGHDHGVDWYVFLSLLTQHKWRSEMYIHAMRTGA
jgi:hypothetical protein